MTFRRSGGDVVMTDTPLRLRLEHDRVPLRPTLPQRGNVEPNPCFNEKAAGPGSAKRTLHAATRMIMLKTCERRYSNNLLICKDSASSRNLQQTTILSLHGGDRKFEQAWRWQNSMLEYGYFARKLIVALRRSKGQPPTATACCIRRVTAWRVELVAESGKGA